MKVTAPFPCLLDVVNSLHSARTMKHTSMIILVAI